MKYITAQAGKIRDAAGRSGECGREKPPAAKPSVNDLPVRGLAIFRTCQLTWRTSCVYIILFYRHKQ